MDASLEAVEVYVLTVGYFGWSCNNQSNRMGWKKKWISLFMMYYPWFVDRGRHLKGRRLTSL